MSYNKEKRKEYYKENKERILAYQKSRRERNNELQRKRYWLDPEKYRRQSALIQKKNSKKIAEKRKGEKVKQRENYKDLTKVETQRRAWTPEEIEFLRENYQNLSILDLAQYLDRTWAATSRKLCKERLIKKPHRHV